ncbi:MAG: hypothetical protein ACOC1U_07060 [Spirochaetota bacterium]
MNFGWDDKLNWDRIDAYERDGETARLAGWWHRPSARARRGATRVGNAVRHALAATECCRWDEVERAIEELERIELRPVAQIAVRTVYAQVLGREREAIRLIEQLGRTGVATGADPHVWASGVIAAALHGYLTGGVSGTAQPVSLVRQMCARFGELEPESAHLMCFSLALLARAGSSPVLAAFLLGHLADSGDARQRPTLRMEHRARGHAALRASTGLCILTLGDVATGARVLVGLIEGSEAARMPLVTGLVGAELARLELTGGDTHAAGRWIERTHRFSERYGARLPQQVISRVREQVPG